MKHVLYITFLSVLFACNNEEVNVDDFKSDASGKRGEVLVIMDDFYWENEAGQTLQEYFEAHLPATPQPPEAQLELRAYPHQNFNRNHKTNRNILLVDFDSSKVRKTKLEIKRDKWMKKQLYVEITSPNMADFVSFMEQQGQDLVEVFLKEERKRVQTYFKSEENSLITKKIKEKHQLDIIIPKQYTIVTSNDEFLSAMYERMISRNGRMMDLQQGVFIYHYPYESDTIFSKDYLIQKRNEILGKYVKGAEDTEYMTTNDDPRIQHVLDTVSLDGNFAVELRGLWRIESQFGMGGPFISLTTIDEENNRVVTVEGMVFAPNSPKRELLRDLEAILYSLSF